MFDRAGFLRAHCTLVSNRSNPALPRASPRPRTLSRHDSGVASRRVSGRTLAAVTALALLPLAGFGCSTTGLGATEPQLAKARDRASAGAEIFANECVRCHGKRGQGLAGAPEILGPGALPEYPRNMSTGMQAIVDPDQLQIQQQTRPTGAPTRDVFRTADDLHTYVHDHLPKARAAAMKSDDYWAVVTFMLAAQGADVPPEGIGPSNASSFPIPR